jgi:hypothetical protein
MHQWHWFCHPPARWSDSVGNRIDK